MSNQTSEIIVEQNVMDHKNADINDGTFESQSRSRTCCGSSGLKGNVWRQSILRRFRFALFTNSWRVLLWSLNQFVHEKPGTWGTWTLYFDTRERIDSNMIFLVQNRLRSFSRELIPFSASKMISKIFWFLLVRKLLPETSDPVFPTKSPPSSWIKAK